MISWAALGSLVFASAAIMGSPGPATISLVASASAYGPRRSLPYLAGIVGGTWLVLLAVAAGVTAALVAVPGLGPALVGVSVVYILWLAYHIATAPPLHGTAEGDAPSLAGGLLLGVGNPKAWLAIAAVFSSARLADGEAANALAKGIVLTVMIVLINAAWLLAGASLAPLMRSARSSRMVNGVLAVALVVATAAAILVEP